MPDSFRFSSEVAPEVLAYLDAKNLRPAFSWQDVWAEEHAHAFTVAKAMQADVLNAIRAELRRALEEGRTLESFKADLQPRLEALGWWGRREMTDPEAGETKEVQLGSPRRLRTIYNSNVRAARAAGQWERIERTKGLLPFLLYGLGPSEKHRPHHANKEGLVLSVDDPFWREWMPPNGWGCKCHVRQLTRREAVSRGISESPSFDRVPFTNRRTGEVTDVPRGIDPGWHTNPGLARMATLLDGLSEKLAVAGEANARTAIADLWRDPFARAFAVSVPRAGAPAGISGVAQDRLDAVSPVVAVYNDTVRAKSTKHAPVSPLAFDLVARILDEGVFVDQGRPASVSVYAEIGGQWWKAVVRRSATGYLRVSTLHPSSADKLRRAQAAAGNN